MKKTCATFLLLTSISALAEIQVNCDVYKSGVVQDSCYTTVSSDTKEGEVKLAPKESFKLSSLEGCTIDNEYDLVIENTSRHNRVSKNASETERKMLEAANKVNPSKFTFSITTLKKRWFSRRMKLKVKQSQELRDIPFAQISGSLTYTKNGTGLNCKMSNH